jgi:nicotinamide-nucleotide amidase
MLKSEILAIGSELLTPFRTDTNSLYLTRSLEERGIKIVAKTIVGDDLQHLIDAFSNAFDRSDIIIATGGLGPTVDDLTRDALSQFLNLRMVIDQSVLQAIENRFIGRGMRMPPINEKQAMVPEGAIVLENHNGTAPGLFLESRGKQVFLLPGPPFELEPMWEQYALPFLKTDEPLTRHIFRIAMMPESRVDELLKPVSEKLKDTQYTILASPAEIEIHLLAPVHAMNELNWGRDQIKKILGNKIYGEGLQKLEEVVGNLLLNSKQTISVAESCTGGLLSHRLTQISGSSKYFNRAAVVYSNTAKIQMLEVPLELIEKNGAVSSPVAMTMAEEIRSSSRTDFGIGITGIAGPEGGTPEKPVGLVYIALADLRTTRVERYHFPPGRERVKFMSTQAALNLLRLRLLE